MTDIVVQTKKNGLAVNGLVDDPEITIIRLDTDAVVVNGAAMSDTGTGGLYKYNFAPVQGLRYAFSVEADPNATGQTDDFFYSGGFDFSVVTGAYQDGAIWVDSGGVPGTVAGENGTQANPVDNLTDAFALSVTTGLKRFRITEGSFTIPSAIEGAEFIGLGPSGIAGGTPRIIDLNSQDVGGCYFEGLFVLGDANTPSAIVRFKECALSNLLNCRIQAEFCGLQNTISLSFGSFFHQCYSRVPGGQTVAIDVQGNDLNNRGYSGGCTLRGVTAGAAVSLEFIAGQCIIDASCTNGDIQVRGVVSPVTDNSAGATVTQVAAVQGVHLDDIWQNEGLDPDNSKTITENVAGADYDEAVGSISKSVTKVGAVTTIDRA